MDRLYGILEKDSQIERINGSIKKDYSIKDYRHLAANYRALAKILFKNGYYLYALEKLDLAAQYNNKCSLYEREFQDRLYMAEILLLQNNQFDLANQYSIIANICRDKLKNSKMATRYFRNAALSFEQIGNYFACHKMAYQAYLNAEAVNEKKDMLNIAIRASIKQQLHKKVIFYTDELLKLISPDLHNHDYLSTCMKGYHAAKRLDDNQKIIDYLKPHIECHRNGIIEQRDIKEVTKDYITAYVKHKRIVDLEVQSVIDDVFKDLQEKSNTYSDLSSICYEIGLIDDGSRLKIVSYDYLKAYYLQEKKYAKHMVLNIWKLTSRYGESLLCWSIVSCIFIMIFACIYGITYKIAPSTFTVSEPTIFTPFYFSVVTFTTLGFGDIYPTSPFGQLMVIIEVLIGYMMLGGIVSIFSKKVIR